jgi:SAM-dependent methyltransferase
MPSRTGDQGQGHPVLFGFAPAWTFVAHPDGGGYPLTFLERAYPTLGVTDPTKVLHLCSGSLRIGVRVDIRPEMEPDIIADCRSVPLPDESFDWIMADPPYSEDYATNLYGTGIDYPKPGQIIREASRLLRPGGRVGILHFQVPMHRPPLRMVGVWGITTGAGYAIRAWTVFEKAQAGFWGAPAGPRPTPPATDVQP